MQVVPLEPARRLRGDGGSAIVEAAFIAPLFMYLLMGVLEFGMYFRDWLTLGAGITDGARVLAIQGNAIDTDFKALQQIKTTMGGINQSDITKIIVFNPELTGANPTSTTNPFDAVVPPSCTAITTQAIGANGINDQTGALPSSATIQCNVYTPAVAWASSATSAQYGCATTGQPNYSKWFCPTTRRTAQTNASGASPPLGPPSYVGLYIEINHKFITGLFGTTRKLTQQIILRNEPQSLQ